MLRTRYKADIDIAADKYRLDSLLIEAMVVQESSGNTDAFTFCPEYWNRNLKNRPEYHPLNPRRISSKYGLMGVMYCRLEGVSWAPELLFIPENGLDLGCALYAELVEWAQCLPLANKGETVDLIALAAYTGGKGGNDPNKHWPLRNAAYAKQVLAKRVILEQEYKG